MGVNVTNVELLKDYRNNRQTFRIHLDVPLNNALAAEVRDLLDAGDLAKAKAKVKSVAGTSAGPVIDAVTLPPKKKAKVTRKP